MPADIRDTENSEPLAGGPVCLGNFAYFSVLFLHIHAIFKSVNYAHLAIVAAGYKSGARLFR